MKTWFKDKRRRLWIAFTFVLITGILFLFVSSGFYFPHSQFWLLPQLQWDEQPDAEPSGERPVVIGHRGSGLDSTENEGQLIGNTTKAIQAGIDANADWIEIDIRITEGRRLVVFHDEEIEFRTDGEGNVAALTLEELQGVAVSVKPTEKILTLEQVFTQFHSEGQRWIFDIKAEEISVEFLDWLDQSGLSKEQVILFGDYELLLDYKDSVYTLGYTTLFDDNYLNVLFNPSQIIANCETLNCKYLVLNMVFAKKSLVDLAKAKGIEVWVYGSDDITDLENMRKIGISGFIVDDPATVLDYFETER